MEKGDKLQNVTVSDLGRATRFICRRGESIIEGPKGKKMDVEILASSIKLAIDSETDETQKNALKQRLGMLTNTLAIIKVGAPTENERKALKYKTEDAINSVKSAYDNGVVSGAGIALANIKTSSPILNEALKYPARQLRKNMGLDEDYSLKPDEALNVVTGRVGKYLDVGVVDPVDVLLAGVESAVSIASILVTSSGIIVDVPKEPKQ